MYARINQERNVCEIANYEGVVLADVYCCPDGDMVMSILEAEIQLGLLGLVRASSWVVTSYGWVTPIKFKECN